MESREFGEPLTNTKQVTLELRSGHTVSVLVSMVTMRSEIFAGATTDLDSVIYFWASCLLYKTMKYHSSGWFTPRQI